jgi:site-specific DNA-methyltransferase (cytosine-N4-specific)
MPHDNVLNLDSPGDVISTVPDLTRTYETQRGQMFNGLAEEVLKSKHLKKYQGSVQMIFTSPPFPLNRKKKYGNRQGEEFISWLSGFAELFRRFLKKDGSIVIEMGNSWEPGEPIMSTLALKSLLAFLDAGDLRLCQQFIAYNPARLPSPAQWVNVERIRVKDSFTHIWWMAPNSRPKANNRGVLNNYSKAMNRLLETGKYNAGGRPSEHHIGETSFSKNNGGAIPSNVLTVANTSSSDPYLNFCRDFGIGVHPARMPAKIPEFFINFLTSKRNLVLDPFAGSNTTGEAAEKLKRRWISIEANNQYVQSSIGRFSGLWSPIGQL